MQFRWANFSSCFTLGRRECTNQLTHQVSSEGHLPVFVSCRGGWFVRSFAVRQLWDWGYRKTGTKDSSTICILFKVHALCIDKRVAWSSKDWTTSARLFVVCSENSMSQLLGCLEHLQRGALSMVTSVWRTENNHKVISQGSRADDWARTLVFGLKIRVQQLPGEPVHCREEETNCLVLSTRAGHGESSSIGVPEHSKTSSDSLFLRDKLVVNNSLAVVETHKHCLHFLLLKMNGFAFWWCWWLPFSTFAFSCGISENTKFHPLLQSNSRNFYFYEQF